MHIITVIMLGAIISLGITQVWHQVTSLYETAAYCYSKEQRRHVAEAVVAYGIAVYLKNPEIQQAVRSFGTYEMRCESALNFLGAQSTITYKQISEKEIEIAATVLVQGSSEIMSYKMACPEKAK